MIDGKLILRGINFNNGVNNSSTLRWHSIAWGTRIIQG